MNTKDFGEQWMLDGTLEEEGMYTAWEDIMKDREFCASILAKVLIDAGVGIVIGGTGSDEIIEHMVETECCGALRKIREILDDDTFTDEMCFGCIDQIVSLYEELGPGAGSRHDFG